MVGPLIQLQALRLRGGRELCEELREGFADELRGNVVDRGAALGQSATTTPVEV